MRWFFLVEEVFNVDDKGFLGEYVSVVAVCSAGEWLIGGDERRVKTEFCNILSGRYLWSSPYWYVDEEVKEGKGKDVAQHAGDQLFGSLSAWQYVGLH